ncbi:sugar phosphate isomerase/epimerase [Bacillus sp. FJAT-49711]|uniref:sugar phosphate isomerase/epimerase family protein n=1 Tax=Bacillus sp. FJAT-49711 TaxID=2833585 RepID=UPI001BC8F98F|nr:sugar phosphate isomerase/epimerase [Bacillus sp. FJAT-49711]MBS4219073.1 sugar phosphate isomerase/epimerase [Bacillus sp. FJAT-49711]
MSLSLGLQLYSVRDELEKDYLGTLERLAEIGYKNLEVAIHNADEGLKVGGMNAAEVKKQLDRLGMRVVSSHIGPLDKVDWDEVADFSHTLGSEAVGCSIAFFTNYQEILDFSAELNKYGEECRKRDLQFYFHNHFQEFQKFNGKYAMDIVLENTDKDLVKMEFDTYWAVRGGVDPVEYLRQLGDRCGLIHQKDLPATVEKSNLFDVIGEDAEITFESFVKIPKPEEFTEIGEGVLDIASIIREAKKIGAAKYIFVEQDLTPRNQLDSVEISYKNITELLKTNA